MSKTNTFELQSQVYSRIVQGAKWEDLVKEYKKAKGRNETRHLVADGNPTIEDYNKQIEGMIKATGLSIERSRDGGPLLVQDQELTMRSVCLAGSVMRSLVSAVPKTLPEATSIMEAYQQLAAHISRENLEAAISHLGEAEQEVYRVDVTRLYGEPPEEVDTEKGEASS